ncbi:spermatogenesis-associated protein 20 [Tribolium castaneum]|uniref:Spermatogenesis-associated protein 20-like Protein n=1 Tax=Tribolium castaneum TaxID=7070 RepID=D6WUV1_TRICA|nr:PREDICTED: spermatogenesis-associated protein 20 [Tribolium castaneum]EFA07789.1 Spermatogenesis-associated protein 20-like Protein [Tribolium castaneum]|eukprot:XP_008197440.1 PREDICTED: spermatogenesis-associated protein 20 [Tribolium castaneum]
MIITRVVQNPTVQSLFRRLSLSHADLHNISNNFQATASTLPRLRDHEKKPTLKPLLRSMSLGPNLARTMSTSTKTNRLALEKSPYLLQHATNPVDWYPWGQEAFDRAKKENKLIFLSVGYSTCHWCHVMEKESFEDEEVAKIMNQHFINVKVDREERPDVDKLYMAFIQASVGGGGWPMSVFLTPTLEPLAGGTYFPPEDKYGRPGFKTVLKSIAEQWRTKQSAIANSGKYSLEVLRKVSEREISAKQDINVPGEDVWKKCLLQLSHSYEDDFGGFSAQPKFPQPCNLNFLFHMYSRDKHSEQGFRCLHMCLNTLRKMAYGGIHDHVNCGFARYSVDDRWHVPHFEKMLYDQAQLAVSYADAFVVTKDDFFAEVLRDILLYVSRDLSHPLGGFYGAEDADSYPYEGASHKREGAFCVWEFEEISKLLGETKTDDISHRDLFIYHYNVKEDGNVNPAQDPHHELEKKNILVCFGSFEDTSRKFKTSVETVKEILKSCHEILYKERQKRPKPHVDTKIVTSWNGLMISGFAKAGFVLKDQEYINRAILAATFIKKFLYNEQDKTLLRCCYKGDNAKIVQTPTPVNGFLDDYAFLIRGLLDLYEASLDADWLSWAEVLQEQQDRLFWDTKGSGYFTSPANDSSILIRGKEDQDGAEPCGNSIAVHNLIRLAAYLDRADLRAKAGRTLTVFADRLKSIPVALPEMTSALLFYHNSPTQVFIAGPTEDNNTQALIDVVRSRFIPGRILAVTDGPGGLLYRRHESLARLRPIQGKPAAYVCRNFACSLPVTEPEELASNLDGNLAENPDE